MRSLPALAALVLLAGCSQNEPTEKLPPITLVSPPGSDYEGAQLSLDGSQLAWWVKDGTQRQLWTARADLSDAHPRAVKAVINPAPVYWSPDQSRLAVSMMGGSFSNVAVLPADSGEPRVLVGGANASIPTGWIDSSRISYVSLTGAGGGNFVTGSVSLSGDSGVRLFPNEDRPNSGSWSPDGSHVAYMLLDQGRSTLWIADGDGSNPRQLTTEGFETWASGLQSPWSPDGKFLAYESRRTGTSDIWVIPADSGAPRQLTHNIRNDYNPYWSPDGRWIAFLSDRGRQTDIWIVPAAGGTERRVTDDPALEELIGWVGHSDTLAYLTGVGTSTIWRRSLADTTEQQLTPDSIAIQCCQVSPDGKQVLFRISRGAGTDQLAVMPTNGGTWRVLGETDPGNPTFQWSSDGRMIAYPSNQTGTRQAWVMSADGSNPRQLTDWPEGVGDIAWSGDSALYVGSPHASRLGDVWRVPLAGGEPVRVTHVGTVANVLGQTGRSEILITIIGANGAATPGRLGPDGRITPLWKGSNAIPWRLPRTGDSLIVGEIGSQGALTARLVSLRDGGGGRALLAPGWNPLDVSPDGSQLLYSMPAGGGTDLGILDLKSGTTRRLTATAASEDAAAFVPGSDAVLMVRSKPVRRIAKADLRKLMDASGR